MDVQITAPASPPAGRSPGRFSLAGDERLATLAGAGSDRAFAVLYHRYHQRLYRYCRSTLRHDADAQDALQATFAGAYAALREGRRDAPLRPWLYRIAHNEAVSLLRRRQPQAELTEEAAGAGTSAEEQAIARERLATLVSDLQELPERQRGALVMRELGGLSHEEVALALGTSVGAAKQTVFEARRSLQEFAEGRAMTCDDVCRTISDGDRRALRGRRVSSHLRHCPACAAFAAAIPARRTDLKALAPPLGPAAAGGVLAAVLGRGAGRGASGGAAKGTVAGLAGKSAGLTVASKAVIGATLLAGVTVGLSRSLPHGHRAAAPSRVLSIAPPRARRSGGGAGAASTSHHAHRSEAHGPAANHARTGPTATELLGSAGTRNGGSAPGRGREHADALAPAASSHGHHGQGRARSLPGVRKGPSSALPRRTHQPQSPSRHTPAPPAHPTPQAPVRTAPAAEGTGEHAHANAKGARESP